MAHTFTNLLSHVVFSTCGRAPFLVDGIRSDVHAYIGGIMRELKATPIVIGGTSDHVHLLTRVPADMTVADCMRVVKANSSRWLKQRWPERRTFAWQGGYGAFSVSESNRGAVIRYIRPLRGLAARDAALFPRLTPGLPSFIPAAWAK